MVHKNRNERPIWLPRQYWRMLTCYRRSSMTPPRTAATFKSISTPGLHPGTNRRLLSRRPPSTLSATRGRGDRTLGCGRPKSWPDNRLHRGDHRTVEGCKKEVDLVQKLKRETCAFGLTGKESRAMEPGHHAGDHETLPLGRASFGCAGQLHGVDAGQPAPSTCLPRIAVESGLNRPSKRRCSVL
jgi:hypothetical protein